MKKLLVTLASIMLLGGLASCGKDNKKGSDSNNEFSNPFVNTSVAAGSCSSAGSRQELRDKINGNIFPAERYDYDTYFYIKGRIVIKDKELFGVSWLPYQQASFEYETDFTRHSQRNSENASSEFGGNKPTIRDNLLSIVDRAVSYRGNGSYVEILDTNGDIYGFNLCAPLAANPVYHYDKSDDKQYSFNRVTNGF